MNNGKVEYNATGLLNTQARKRQVNTPLGHKQRVIRIGSREDRSASIQALEDRGNKTTLGVGTRSGLLWNWMG
jgi:hypothetical protein